MIQFIDNQLNRITMYRLVLVYLIFLLSVAFFISIANPSSDPFALALTVAFLLAVSAVTNRIFANIFKVPTNVESVYITALDFGTDYHADPIAQRFVVFGMGCDFGKRLKIHYSYQGQAFI